MKKFLFLSLLLGMFLSAQAAENTEFTITGQLPFDSFDGQTACVRGIKVYFPDASHNRKRSLADSIISQVDSAVVTNGIFQIRGETDQPYLATIFIDQKEIGHLILEPGNIMVTLVDTAYQAEVGGTPLNDEYNDVVLAMNRWKGAVSDSLNMNRNPHPEERTWTSDESDDSIPYPSELKRRALALEMEFMERNASPGIFYNYLLKRMMRSSNNPLDQ